MHWLIPLVSHSLSSLLAWRANTITWAAVLVSFVIAATQSIHLWAAFYGLFALHVLVGTGLAITTRFRSGASAAQNGQTKPSIRSAASLSINLLVVMVLVPLHQYYFKLRLKTVPWFHHFRAPAGCLPIPSRTLTEPFKYTWVDALGNQLPYGIVISYAIAMASSFGLSGGSKGHAHGLSTMGIVNAALGALLVASTAAYGLPMCGEDLRDGRHQVAAHIDRTVDWQERTHMAWSPEARYGTFVVLVTLAGSTGAVLAAQVAAAFQKSKIPAQQTTSRAPEEKPSSSAAGGKQNAGKNATTIAQSSGQARNDGGDVGDSDVARSNLLSTLCINVFLTTAVVVGMAVWSWTGPRVEQTGSLLPHTDWDWT